MQEVSSAAVHPPASLPLLFFTHVGTRRAFAAGVTANPDSAWVAQQARNALMQMTEWGLPPKYLLLDNDTKFTDRLDAVFEADGAEVKRVGPVAPNLNGYAERWVQSAKAECLDHFLILGENHLRHVTAEYAKYHNEEQPHRARGNVRSRSPRPRTPDRSKSSVPIRRSEVPAAARRVCCGTTTARRLTRPITSDTRGITARQVSRFRTPSSVPRLADCRDRPPLGVRGARHLHTDRRILDNRG